MSVLLASAALTGCISPGPLEHPVDYPTPPLKPGVYNVTAVDVRPVATHEVEGVFPRELGEILAGKATVAFTVRADGKVADPSIVDADDILFGEAAVVAIRKWQFTPAQLHGAPVDCRMTLPFAFSSPYGYIWDDGGSSAGPPTPPMGADSTAIGTR
jgi:TonB family protein